MNGVNIERVTEYKYLGMMSILRGKMVSSIGVKCVFLLLAER